MANFFFMVLTTFVAFAFLFYNTTMSSLEDQRKLFVRVYLIMLAVFALGSVLFAKPADAKPTALVKTACTSSPTFPISKEATHV